jgi:hypothetical protein
MDSIVLRSCGSCTRVRVGRDWISESDAIRRLRSYELNDPPSFVHELCASCFAELAGRRLARELPDGMLADVA